MSTSAHDKNVCDVTGLKFGKWTVLQRAENKGPGHARWLCRCECGREGIVRGTVLRQGKSTHCRSCNRRTHGATKTRLFTTWASMIQRCGDPNHKDYHTYGNLGIKVCAKWRESFEAFRDWANSHDYRGDLQIDRINNDQGYSPQNCRWVTLLQQARNKRKTRRATVGGVTKTLGEWSELSGVKIETIFGRLSRGWPPMRAVFAPLMRSRAAM